MSRSNMKYCHLHVLGTHDSSLFRCRHALLRQHPQSVKQACKRILPILSFWPAGKQCSILQAARVQMAEVRRMPAGQLWSRHVSA